MKLHRSPKPNTAVKQTHTTNTQAGQLKTRELLLSPSRQPASNRIHRQWLAWNKVEGVDYPGGLQSFEKLFSLRLLKQEALLELPYSGVFQLRLSLVTRREENQRAKREKEKRDTVENRERTREA